MSATILVVRLVRIPYPMHRYVCCVLLLAPVFCSCNLKTGAGAYNSLYACVSDPHRCSVHKNTNTRSPWSRPTRNISPRSPRLPQEHSHTHTHSTPHRAFVRACVRVHYSTRMHIMLIHRFGTSSAVMHNPKTTYNNPTNSSAPQKHNRCAMLQVAGDS